VRYMVIIAVIVFVVGSLMFCHQQDSTNAADRARELRRQLSEGVQEVAEPSLLLDKYLAEAKRKERFLADGDHDASKDLYEVKTTWGEVMSVRTLTVPEYRRRVAEFDEELGVLHRKIAATLDLSKLQALVRELLLRLGEYKACEANYRDRAFALMTQTRLEEAANRLERFRVVAPAKPPPAPEAEKKDDDATVPPPPPPAVDTATPTP